MKVCVLLLLLVCGTESVKYNMSEIPDNAWATKNVPGWINRLSKNNYTDEGYLDILDNMAKYLYKWNKKENVKFGSTLVENGLMKVFDIWLDHFQHQSEQDLSRQLFGKFFQIVYNGAKLDTFNEQLLRTGLLRKALQLTMNFEVLFGDPLFTEDIRIVSYGTCWNIYFFASSHPTIKFDLISAANSAYGERFKKVDKLNSAKHSEMYQLYRGKLLALLEPTETEMDERYTLERPVLLKLREKYLEEIKFRKGNFSSIPYHLITDLVFEEWHLYYYDILTLFNNLLMSKTNAIQLCDNTTFEHYLVALEIFAVMKDSASPKDLEKFMVRAIWGLTILQHSCDHGEQYYNQQMRDNLKLSSTYKQDMIAQESKVLLSSITSETKFCPNGSLSFRIEQIGVRPVCGPVVAQQSHSNSKTPGVMLVGTLLLLLLVHLS